MIALIAALILCAPLPAAEKAAAAEKVALQLRWDHQFQFAGYYAAQWQGYYRDAGLEVEIRSAVTPDRKILKAVEEVAAGRADFGIGAADILVAHDRGQPLALVATVFQQSAARFYALEKSALRAPADLMRLRVARNLNDLIDVELQAMLRAEGIDPARVKAHPHEPGIDHLLAGRVEVIPGYETSIPYYARRAGVKLNSLAPAGYGIDFYGDAIFTRQSLTEQKPDLVNRFRTASLKGWRYALENPQEIAARITRELPRHDRVEDLSSFNRFQAEKIPELTLYPLVELGHINPERWKRMHDLLRTSGIVKGQFDDAAFIHDPEARERKRQEEIRSAAILVLTILSLVSITSLLWISKLSRTIRQRDRALREVRSGEERYRALFEDNPIETVVVDPEGRITGFNLAKRRSGGGQPAIGQIMYRDYARDHARDMYGELLTAIRTGMGRYFPELKYHNKYLDIRIAPFSGGAMITAIDMTSRRQAEEDLKIFRDIFRYTRVGIVVGDPEARIIGMMNPAFAAMHGYTVEELAGRPIADIFDVAAFHSFPEHIRKAHDKGFHVFETVHVRKDGSPFPVLNILTAVKDATDKVLYRIVNILDISALKQAEEDRRRAEERYRNIVDNAVEGIFQTTPDGRFIMVNPAMAQILGYSAPGEVLDTLTDIAHQLYVDPRERTRLMRLLQCEGKVRDYEMELCRKDGNRIWVSSNIRAVLNRSGGIDYYEGFLQDITELRKAAQFRQQSVDRLRKAMGATIQTLSMTVETRDPYTAGHQRRVADLARRIAAELRLSPEQIEGLRMAALVHDIGKVSIPAEILSKPTRLTDLEIKFIRIHADTGYEILKDIEFPWPVADIVRQHHERLDGSGYPRGLKGGEILMEARILSVADTVEAMSSHRPYRPALGLEAALAEIEINAGTHYDAETVRACLHLFRAEGYRFE